MKMKRGSNLAIPFSMALVLHTVGVVCAGLILVRETAGGAMVPAFQKGESSMEVTLLSSVSRPERPQPVVPHPQPAVSIQERPQPAIPLPQPVVKIEEPVPLADSEAVSMNTAGQSDPYPEDIPAPDPGVETAGAKGPDWPGEDINADGLAKGVEGGAYPVSAIRPVYPLGSRLRGEEGSVVLSVKVDARGEVEGVTVIESSGYSGLDNTATKAVQRARFVPAQRDGKPREGEARLTVRFRLVD